MTATIACALVIPSQPPANAMLETGAAGSALGASRATVAAYPATQKSLARAATRAWRAGRLAELRRYEAYAGRGAHLDIAIEQAVGGNRPYLGPYFCFQRWCSFVAIDFSPTYRMTRVAGRWKISGVLNPHLYAGAYSASDRTDSCTSTVKSATWLQGSNTAQSSALRRLARGTTVGVYQFDNRNAPCKKSAIRKSLSDGWAVVSLDGGRWWGYVKKGKITTPS